ncbi:hypothetical protein [Streptomyces sp. NPDC014676]|uniref:hypothetical protein n=1 Tax=Streptomyces sp. NPDC014676 TaxID=3364879 RepID=UPI0036FE815E
MTARHGGRRPSRAEPGGRSAAHGFRPRHHGRRHAPTLARPGQRSVVLSSRGSARYERVTPHDVGLEVPHAVLEPGVTTSDRLRSHPAVECAYVIAGRPPRAAVPGESW